MWPVGSIQGRTVRGVYALSGPANSNLISNMHETISMQSQAPDFKRLAKEWLSAKTNQVKSGV